MHDSPQYTASDPAVASPLRRSAKGWHAQPDAGRRSLAALLLTVTLGACSGPDQPAPLAEQLDLLDRWCTDCHNDAEFAGDVSFASISTADVAARPELFESVVRKLSGHLMPPPAEPRPDAATLDAFVAALETELDAVATTRGAMPGKVGLHRLNRTEYARAVEDLLGVDIDARAMLPGDDASDGFDNVAAVLGVSPTHLDQYLAAARDISIQAIGEPSPEPGRADYRSDRQNKTTHVDGLPLGTRGGLLVEHTFPADGEYRLNLTIASIPGSELRGYPYGWLEYDNELVVTVDGVPVFADHIGGERDLKALDQGQIQAIDAIRARFQNIPLDVAAGRRKIGATFVARSFAEGDYLLRSPTPGEGLPDLPRLFGLEILGPYAPTGIGGTTTSRDRIFVCYPSEAAEEEPCARQILTHLARRAYRRPVSDADIEPLLGFYAAGRELRGFETGIQKGLMAILASTNFLYRAEPDRGDGAASGDAAYPIDDLELAWRLSFFLWSQGPDEQLLELAETGRLSDDDVLVAQVRRMLADRRSRSLVTNFAFQWLGVRRLEQIDPDPRLYPSFDEDLRSAMRTEMELYLDSILRADRSVLDVLSASHTFVNERLARHYGIPGVLGDQFRRVELEDPRRHGLFGKASVLLVTSYPDRTSPVLRGAWIMEQVLGTPPAPVPPNVETDLSPVPGDVPRSVRERLALHRTEPSCNHCHGVIDPLGQALENYDVVGVWRTAERDNGALIDSTGELAGGGRIEGPQDLRRALLDDPDLFVQALTEKLLTYALGRGLEYYDMPTVRAIARAARRDDYRFATIVAGVVRSDAFRMRSDVGTETPVSASNTTADAAR